MEKGRSPPERYTESVRKLGQEMQRKDGTGEVVFTDHAVWRMYNRRVHVAKVLMTVDNPDREMDSEEGPRYRRLLKNIGCRTVYVSIVREKAEDSESGKVRNKTVVISVGWRARGRKKGRKDDPGC